MLPYVILANRSAIESKTIELCAVLNIEKGFDDFFEWVLYFREMLGIPNTLADIGLNTDRAAEIGKLALADPSAGGNPINFSAAEYQQIFENAVTGKLT